MIVGIHIKPKPLRPREIRLSELEISAIWHVRLLSKAIRKHYRGRSRSRWCKLSPEQVEDVVAGVKPMSPVSEACAAAHLPFVAFDGSSFTNAIMTGSQFSKNSWKGVKVKGGDWSRVSRWGGKYPFYLKLPFKAPGYDPRYTPADRSVA